MSQQVSSMQLPKSASIAQKREGFAKPVTRYDLARLAQVVNSVHCSGYSGSRKEKEHCESWNIRPVNPNRIV